MNCFVVDVHIHVFLPLNLLPRQKSATTFLSGVYFPRYAVA